MDAAMPRSLPVTTGRPWSFGRRDCSQEAKNASPSMCTMARGNVESVSGSISGVLTDHRTHHGRNLQLLGRVDRLKLLIGRFEEHLPAAPPEIFHGPLPVHLGDHDVAVTGFCSALDQEHVTRQ